MANYLKYSHNLAYHTSMQPEDYRQLIEIAIKEDFAAIGDITSQAIFTDETCTARLISKDQGILAGTELFKAVFTAIDPQISVKFHKHDGQEIEKSACLAKITGKTQPVLSAERIALNFLCFLSGIATATRSAVQTALENGRAIILDTRKTLPGYRKLSKYAVKIGGGKNHRLGLFDLILIKDNHIDAVGSISQAVARVRKKWGSTYKIEVECRNLAQVKEALDNKVDIVMLDNMNDDMISQAVRINAGRIPLEASGKMNLEKIAAVSRLGVDYISAGMLTHSVRSLDLSLQVEMDNTQKR